ncbi:NAD-dependent dehydrogenase subunit [Candidatus Magnetoovum chiemensis]|nr:NAD-dependent dehydrogenase subunit [Candidatus Magnetoovum chiemensis]
MLNYLSLVLFGATLLYISTTSRLGAYVKILAMQGVLLFLAAMTHTHSFGFFHTAFITFETLIVKAALIPAFIFFIIKQIGIKRETEPYIDNFFSLIAATFIIALSFVLSVMISKQTGGIDVLAFGISLSAVIVGLFIMVTCKKIITHVMGYLVLENGVFLMSLGLAAEVPILVEAGVLLDVFIGLFLMGIFINKVKSSFDSADVSELTRLAD